MMRPTKRKNSELFLDAKKVRKNDICISILYDIIAMTNCMSILIVNLDSYINFHLFLCNLFHNYSPQKKHEKILIVIDRGIEGVG